MTDAPFSNREIRSMFESYGHKLDDILKQTTRTNGRVSTLESRQDDMDKWRYFIMGGLGILTVLVVPILLALALRII